MMVSGYCYISLSPCIQDARIDAPWPKYAHHTSMFLFACFNANSIDLSEPSIVDILDKLYQCLKHHLCLESIPLELMIRRIAIT